MWRAWQVKSTCVRARLRVTPCGQSDSIWVWTRYTGQILSVFWRVTEQILSVFWHACLIEIYLSLGMLALPCRSDFVWVWACLTGQILRVCWHAWHVRFCLNLGMFDRSDSNYVFARRRDQILSVVGTLDRWDSIWVWECLTGHSYLIWASLKVRFYLCLARMTGHAIWVWACLTGQILSVFGHSWQVRFYPWWVCMTGQNITVIRNEWKVKICLFHGVLDRSASICVWAWLTDQILTVIRPSWEVRFYLCYGMHHRSASMCYTEWMTSQNLSVLGHAWWEVRLCLC
jgi:hypothetical protein